MHNITFHCKSHLPLHFRYHSMTNSHGSGTRNNDLIFSFAIWSTVDAFYAWRCRITVEFPLTLASAATTAWALCFLGQHYY
jgi:hypothetical protein